MNSNDVAKEHNNGSTQFTYFLAGAAGAGIGYALTKLDGQPFSPKMVVGLIAIGLWLVSFCSAYAMISWGLKALQSNYQLLQLHEGIHPKQPQSELEHDIAVRVTGSSADRKITIAKWCRRLQIWSLFLGVLTFIAWRLWELFSPLKDAKSWCFVPGFAA